ncbi:MAG: YbhB/YbcL family Raf kinase inhibitor-like protein [Pyrinomonadaceae bacterium]
MFKKICIPLFTLILLCSCTGKKEISSENAGQKNAQPEASREVKKMEIKVTSAAFQEGGAIPKQYTCDGANVSPALAWTGVPEKAVTLALIVDDPDAPAKTWVHWVVFNLSATAKGLPENVPAQENVAGGGRQGTSDFKKVGYGGPCPPSGTHRYFFKLYALDTSVADESKTTKEQLLKEMEGHVLAEGQLMGTYKR